MRMVFFGLQGSHVPSSESLAMYTKLFFMHLLYLKTVLPLKSFIGTCAYAQLEMGSQLKEDASQESYPEDKIYL